MGREANWAGPHSAAPPRTMDRARCGRGPHPSRGRRKKRDPSRLGDRSTLQSRVPGAQALIREGSEEHHLCPFLAPTARRVALPSLACTWVYHPAGHPLLQMGVCARDSKAGFLATQQGRTHPSLAASTGPHPTCGDRLGTPPPPLRPRPEQGSHPKLCSVANRTRRRPGLG